MNPIGDTTSTLPIPAETEALAREVVDSSLAVHRSLGPGLLESVYEVCLDYELRKRGVEVEREVALPIEYDGVRLDAGLRLDLLETDGSSIRPANQFQRAAYSGRHQTYCTLTTCARCE